MTRVNLQPPDTLCDQHLLAELREIKRIPNSIVSGKLKPGPLTSAFVLGPGHVKFFTDKLGWLKSRYDSLFKECRARGFNVQYMWPSGLPGHLCNNWVPSRREVSLSEARVKSKLPNKPRWGK